MIKVNGFVAGSVLGAAMLASGPALAATGFVSGVSEYTFRGINSQEGAAVQGELDWSSGGAYLGAWASNAALVGGTELDLYGGYKFTLSDVSNIDIGAIYYYFPEEDEFNISFSYPEIYIGLNYGGFSGKVYYADKFFDDGGGNKESIYANVSYTYAISDTLSLKGAIGNQSGDGEENAYFTNDSVWDYAVTLTKTLDAGFAASFAVVGTDMDSALRFGLPTGRSDKPKVVIGLTKNFEL